MENHEDTGIYGQLRQLITTVDQLRDVGLQQFVKLPRICVVGTQSAGKSSLLEAIVGISFLPRGDGVVTRRPLEMRLCHNSSIEKSYCIFEDDSTKYEDFDLVKKLIADKTDEVAGKRKGIIDNPIKVSIYGNRVPDLTLIDLPGITRVPLRDSDQTEDVEQITKDMVTRYAEDERTIILAVIPANQDISTSDALQLARKLDAKGIRTLGVVTKIDLMDRGTNAVNILRGRDVELRLGYIGVKLRSQLDIENNISIRDSLEQESAYFGSHAAYSNLPSKYLGTQTLVSKLAVVLFTHIKHCLPSISKEIGDLMMSTNEDLRRIGLGTPDDEFARQDMMMKLLQEFSASFENAISGKYDARLRDYFNKTDKVVGGGEIRDNLNALLTKFQKIDITIDYSDEEIDKSIRNYEGHSLQGFFSIHTFESLLKPKLGNLEEPVYECLDRIFSILENLVRYIATKVFISFSALRQETTVLCLKILNDQKDITAAKLRDLVSAETEYLFTNDSRYLKKHANIGDLMPKKLLEDAAQDENTRIIPHILDAKSASNNPPIPFDPISLNLNIVEIAQAGLSAMKDTLYNKSFIDKVRSRLNDFFRVIVNSIRESAPKFIGRYLILGTVNVMERKLHLELNKKPTDYLLGEDLNTAKHRIELKKQSKVLSEASYVLNYGLMNSIESMDGGFDADFGRDVDSIFSILEPSHDDE